MSFSRKITLIILTVLATASVSLLFGCGKINGGEIKPAPSKTNYTVSFVDENGASIYDSKTYSIGEKAEKPEKPTRTGYVFKYWAYDGKRYNFNATPDVDIALVAVWEQTYISHTVTLEVNGFYEYISCLDGETFTLPESEERKADEKFTYTFEKWVTITDGVKQDAEKEVVVTEDLHFVAEFTETLRVYTVTFIDKDHKEFYGYSLNYGEKITLPETNPENTSDKAYEYAFVGWNGYESEMTVKGNTCFVANYKAVPRVYEITYKAFDDVVKTEYCAYEGTLTFPTGFSYVGYDFSSWEYNGETLSETSLVDGDMEIIATFTPKKYNVFFDTLSVYVKEPMEFTIEDEMLIPEDANMAMDGYEFLGWYIGSEKVEKIKKGTYGNLTLTARWKDSNFVLVTELKGVSKVYDKTSAPLTFEAEYHDKEITVEYNWYFKPNGETEFKLLEEKGSVLNVSEVKDSGEYYAKAVVGAKQLESAKVTVTIEKAEQVIYVQKEQVYVYDGELHGLQGVSLLSGDAEPIISYGDSEYDGLIDAGEITVTIIVGETDNYKEAMTTAKLIVEPKKVQVFSREIEYNGNNLWKDVELYYYDINGNEQVANAINPYDIIDVGNYPVDAVCDSANYVVGDEYVTVVKVLPTDYTGEVPSVPEQTGYINKTVSSIVLPDSSFVWKNVEEVMTKEGEYDAYYNAGTNYKPTPVKISVKLKAKVTFKTGGGDTGFDDVTKDVNLGGKVIFPVGTNDDGEELIWFANDAGVGRFYRGNAETPSATDNVTYYGLWYYQTKSSEYSTDGTTLTKYNGKVYSRMILPTDAQYNAVYPSSTTWNPGDAFGVFNSNTLTCLIIPKNITKINYRKYISSLTEVDAFSYCGKLSDVIIEGNCDLSKLTFTGKGTSGHAITNLTLLSTGATRASSENSLSCNVWVSTANTGAFSSAVWGDNVKNFETL